METRQICSCMRHSIGLRFGLEPINKDLSSNPTHRHTSPVYCDLLLGKSITDIYHVLNFMPTTFAVAVGRTESVAKMRRRPLLSNPEDAKGGFPSKKPRNGKKLLWKHFSPADLCHRDR